MTHRELRQLTTMACRACAALLPISADGEGKDSHGGNLLAHRGRIVAQALKDLEAAGDLARQYRRDASRVLPDRPRNR